MTADRAKKLQEIGFTWNVSKRRSSKIKTHSSNSPVSESLKIVHEELSFPEASLSVASPTDDDSYLSSEISADIAAAKVLIRMH
jgi:hypothetical protein